MKIEKLVKEIACRLDKCGFQYEVYGDKFTFAVAPTATIMTENCTIELHKNEIKVNERFVKNVDEMMSVVTGIEN